MKFFDRFKSKRKAAEEAREDTAADNSSAPSPAQDSNTDQARPADVADLAVDAHSAEPALEPMPEAIPETIPEAFPDTIPEAIPETIPEATPEAIPETAADAKPTKTPEPVAEPPADKKPGLFARLKQGLKRTGNNFSEGMGNLFLGRKTIDDELFEDLETQLLMADVGIEATRQIMDNLSRRVSRKELADAAALYTALQQELEELLAPSVAPLQIDPGQRPYVILMVGVNGVGKTTTIGKLAKRFQSEGKSVMLAAGDTFRAAAVEQLQVWGERNNVPVVAQHTGADSASVIYDAVQAAQSRDIDVLIADTAGRLHNKDNLMEELRKVVRVMGKLDDTAPHEVMLVLDAGTGQNALSQAKHFQEAVGVSGITLTKLDGTAKGGIIFAISKQLQLPIRFIGVGEQVDDLRPFVAGDFIAALFTSDETAAE